MMINNTAASGNASEAQKKKRKNEKIMQFQLILMSGKWKSVYEDNNTSNKFKSFLYIFLNICDSVFLIK